MEDTVKTIVERIAIHFPTPTRIPSGHVCSIFYDCFQLTPNDLARLAAHAVGHLDHDAFDIAVGRAYSGILFAAAVAGGRKVAILQKDGRFFGPDLKGQRVVLVDDVVYAGYNMRDGTEKIQAEGGTLVGRVAIIDRSKGVFAESDTTIPFWCAFQTDME
jgi:orotate phosphoribosyltransferase